MCGQIAHLYNKILKGLPTMKLYVRAFALMIVLAGFAAASLSSSTPKKAIVSHQSATASFPIALCGPGIPTCGLR